MYMLAFAILLVAQVLDVFYTKMILVNGGRELNIMTELVIVELGWAALLLMKSLPALIGVYNSARWEEGVSKRSAPVRVLVGSAIYGMTGFYIVMIGFYTWVVLNDLHL